MLKDNPCSLCPRACGVDRRSQKGYCGCGENVKAALAAAHYWEEPCISGQRGSGTVFFSGCTLGCCYCQNKKISLQGYGKEITVERLAQIFLELQQQGAHNINLVTADMYLPQVLRALGMAKPGLRIPVVYNCSGYQSIEAIEALKGYADIFLPDLKYFSPELSQRYSGAADYFDTASRAIIKMTAQAGEPVFDREGMLQKGVIIRHMVLPGCRKDSIALLHWLCENIPKEKYILSLMCQYTPPDACPHPHLMRRVTAFEYDSVVNEAVKLGLERGYMQKKGSASGEYTPPFDLRGL